MNFIAAAKETRPRSEWPSANFRFVGPDFFRALNIRVVRGRLFTGRECAIDWPAPALVSESTAARLWPGENALGKHFSRGNPEEQGFEVVGVVAKARITSLVAAPSLMVYVPYWWNSPAANRTTTSLLIKSAIDPGALMSAVRRVVRDIDSDIAVGDARPLSDIVDAALAPRRYQVRLFIAFGLVALIIAAVGVYGSRAMACRAGAGR